MTRTVVLGALIAVGALSVGIAGQQQRAALPDLQKVKDNLYIIGSSSPADRSQFTGGNVSVFVTDAGVTVVDSKLAGYGPDIIARIKAVTNKPITTLINTHTHGDHTGSNDGFPATVDIVAHENTKMLMAKMDAFKGEKAQFLPKQTYKDKLTLGSGKDRGGAATSARAHRRRRRWCSSRRCGSRRQATSGPGRTRRCSTSRTTGVASNCRRRSPRHWQPSRTSTP